MEEGGAQKAKLSMMKLTGECKVESSSALLNSKAERSMMLKLRVERPLSRLKWEGGMG